MGRKIAAILMTGILSVAMVACSNTTGESLKQIEAQDAINEGQERRFEDLGITVKLPEKWKARQANIDMYGELPEENVEGQLVISFILDETMEKAKKLNKESESIPETDTKRIQEFSAALMDLTKEFKELCTVASINKSKEEGNLQKELFSKYDHKELISTEDNLEFYLLYNDKPATDALAEKSKKAYEEVYGEVKNLKELIQTFEPVSEIEKLSEYKKIKFETETLEGEKINSDIFKDSKFTMINIWATYCGPCIEEMPEIEELYEELRDQQVNVIGLVSDVTDEETKALAKEIISKKGVQFTNIIPSEGLINGLLGDISGVPTTVFVDSEGNVIGDFLVGAYSKDEYIKAIEDRLANVE